MGVSLRDRLYSCLLTVQALYTVFVKTSVVCKHPGWCSLLVQEALSTVCENSRSDTVHVL